jgi:hypothetical protein
MTLPVGEICGRADALVADLQRVVRGHTDSLVERDADAVAAMAASQLVAELVFAMTARMHPTPPRTPEQIVGSILRMPWKTTVEVVVARARNPRPR